MNPEVYDWLLIILNAAQARKDVSVPSWTEEEQDRFNWDKLYGWERENNGGILIWNMSIFGSTSIILYQYNSGKASFPLDREKKKGKIILYIAQVRTDLAW